MHQMRTRYLFFPQNIHGLSLKFKHRSGFNICLQVTFIDEHESTICQ